MKLKPYVITYNWRGELVMLPVIKFLAYSVINKRLDEKGWYISEEYDEKFWKHTIEKPDQLPKKTVLLSLSKNMKLIPVKVLCDCLNDIYIIPLKSVPKFQKIDAARMVCSNMDTTLEDEFETAFWKYALTEKVIADMPILHIIKTD